MPDQTFDPQSIHLTPEELSIRWKGAIKPATLAAWRYRGQGPGFIRLGDKILYPLSAVEAYEKNNTVSAANGPADEKE